MIFTIILKMYTTINDSENVHKNDDTANNDELLDSEISDDEIRKAILSQNNNKNPGIDQLTADIFKCSIDIILPFFKGIYNRIFLTHEYPPSWSKSIITPVFNKGDPNDATNYRGITLTNIIANIYSQILLNRLNKWSDINAKLTLNQFGFQKGKSILDCIFVLQSIIFTPLFPLLQYPLPDE